MFVSEYLVTEHYGGPEEGGWWYVRYHFVRLVTPRRYDKATARSIARQKNAAYNAHLKSLSYGEQRRERERRTAYLTERTPRESDTSRMPRPHYC